MKAVNGEVKFSKWIVPFSGFFANVIDKRDSFKGGPICYDGQEGSKPFDVATIKAFWDTLHGCQELFRIDLVISTQLTLFHSKMRKMIFEP